MENVFLARRDHDDQAEDWISELPDDILLSIMSPMQIEEAARTSILSKRWRYLWAKQTHLHFNRLVLFPELVPDATLALATTDQKTKYVNWVNQVVDLHCGPCIDTFKVKFQFGNSVAHHIDKWMRFAASKKVKHLHLTSLYNNGDVLYTIGFDILKPLPSPGNGDLSFLISLHLDGINISGDVLEFLLSWCRLLERLYVSGSRTLKRFKVSGPSSMLKQLTIDCCGNLEELEIDAPNLISFSYYSMNHDLSLVFKSVPMLVEIAVGGYNLNAILARIFHLAGQLSKLSVDLGICKIIPSESLSTWSFLQELTLKYDYPKEIDLVAVTTWLEAFQMVRELKIEVCYSTAELEMEADELKNLDLGDYDVEGDDSEGGETDSDGEGEGDADVDGDGDGDDGEGDGDNGEWDGDGDGDGDEDEDELQQKTYSNLKVLHVAGFIGGFADVSLILYFAQFACNLETIICDSSCGFNDFDDTGFVEASRSRASKIAKIVPPNIRVEII